MSFFRPLNVMTLAGFGLFAGVMTGCSTYSTANHTPTSQTVAIVESVHTHQNLTEILKPVPDSGLSVDADMSYPIVKLMPFIVKQADALALTATQRQTFADYRQAVQAQRIQLQANEKALRGQLRTALMQGMDKTVTSNLMRRISQTEHTHMELRRNCIETVRATLSEEQYNKLMAMYRASL